MLAVTAAALVALATLLLEDDDLVIFFVLEDGRLDAGAVDERAAKLSVCAFAHHEDFVEIDGVACFRSREGVNLEDVTFSDSKLAALSSDCGFHDKFAKRGGEKRSERGNQEVFSEFYQVLKRIVAIGDLPSSYT